ncbi:hypothetical protein KIN20_032247 [Parelaphostrongylus tenuis]|uniref:Uncharacterized protein n=1 Tax=Parelaphostrongylus tenuis TaxID=148309 RepID=A0AAD5R6S6_PARTN|nr:hypothetical protein KIN20_032247 [Parelaphostrongylus tenuis]
MMKKDISVTGSGTTTASSRSEKKVDQDYTKLPACLKELNTSSNFATSVKPARVHLLYSEQELMTT